MAKVGVHIGGPITLAQATAGQKVPICLVDETDLATLETGISSPTIQISKNYASFASASDGTFAEVGNGWYTVQLNATDTADTGVLQVRVIKASTSAESVATCEVSTSPAEKRTSYIRVRQLNTRG